MCTIYHIFPLCAQELVINKLFSRSTVGEASVKISKSYYNYQPSLVTARVVNTHWWTYLQLYLRVANTSANTKFWRNFALRICCCICVSQIHPQIQRLARFLFFVSQIHPQIQIFLPQIQISFFVFANTKSGAQILMQIPLNPCIFED